MEDEDFTCGCADLAKERAAAICELAANFDSVKNPQVKREMLNTMRLLNEGIAATVRPRGKKGTLVLFQKPDKTV